MLWADVFPVEGEDDSVLLAGGAGAELFPPSLLEVVRVDSFVGVVGAGADSVAPVPEDPESFVVAGASGALSANPKGDSIRLITMRTIPSFIPFILNQLLPIR